MYIYKYISLYPSNNLFERLNFEYLNILNWKGNIEGKTVIIEETRFVWNKKKFDLFHPLGGKNWSTEESLFCPISPFTQTHYH